MAQQNNTVSTGERWKEAAFHPGPPQEARPQVAGKLQQRGRSFFETVHNEFPRHRRQSIKVVCLFVLPVEINLGQWPILCSQRFIAKLSLCHHQSKCKQVESPPCALHF